MVRIMRTGFRPTRSCEIWFISTLFSQHFLVIVHTKLTAMTLVVVGGCQDVAI